MYVLNKCERERGFGFERGGREGAFGGYGAVDVEVRGGFAGWGEPEGGGEGGGGGEEGAGVDEAEGAGGEGGGEVWAD